MPPLLNSRQWLIIITLFLGESHFRFLSNRGLQLPSILKPTMASIQIDQQAARANPASVQAEETYHGSFDPAAPIRLRIATGGAGQSGLVGALADAFINDMAKKKACEPFSVAWLKSDTTGSFNYLGENAADLSITYHAAAEELAIQQGIADRREYAWRDHWLLVGIY